MRATVALPSDLEAEAATLGAVMLDGRQWHAVAALVKAEDFHAAKHAAIYTAAQAVEAAGRPVDMVAVLAELRRRGADVTPLEVRDVVDATPLASSAPSYAAVVARLAAQRRLIIAAGDVIQGASADAVDPEVLVASAISRFQSAFWRGSGDVLSVEEVVTQAMEEMEREAQVDEDRRVRTGIRRVDQVLGGGLMPGRFYVLGARPSVGKSALAGNVALHALQRDVPVLFVSLEMSGREVMTRFVVDHFSLNPAMPNAPIMESMMHSDVLAWPLHFREHADLAGVVAAVRENHYGLVVLDYVQLLPTRQRFERRDLEIAHTTRSLKLLAMEARVPILACAQLARRKDEKGPPRLSDLRESGAQEQDADVVLLLDRDSEDDSPNTKLIVAKNRHGRTGSVELFFDGPRTRFREAAYAVSETRDTYA